MGNPIGRFLCVYLIVLIPFFRCFSQAVVSDKLIFDHFGVADGLSQSWASAIVQDSSGFIWIGTRDGLTRYDARSFKIYRYDAEDSISLNSSHITSLFIDSHDRMWVGTMKGLNVYDTGKDRFDRIPVRDPGYKGIHVNNITEGEGEVIWIAAFEGLFLYDPVDGQGVELVLAPDQTEHTSFIRFKEVFQDSRKDLWVGVENGVIRLSFKGGTDRILQSYLPLPDIAGYENKGTVNDIIEYPEGIFWLATERGGLFRYRSDAREFNHFSEENGLISDHVRILKADADKGELWIGTRNGLSIYGTESQSFRSFQHVIDDPGSLSDNSIHSICKARDGSFWLGTYSSGVNIFSESFFKITTYKAKPDNSGLSNATVSAINEIRPGQILIGTEGGGMNLYNSSQDKYTYYKQGAENSGLPHNNVKCIFEDSDGVFWIGTSGGGICTFDPSEGSFRQQIGNEIGIRDDGGWVYSIAQDQQGVLWFGAFQTGLVWYDKNTGRHGLLTATPDHSFSYDAIRKVFVDSKNKVWIGTDNGLSVYDQQKDTFRYFRGEGGERSILMNNAIFTVYEDSEHTIWIGTLEGGLIRYREPTDSFEAYTVEDGLPGNNIFGILEDDDHNLWLSTNRGISKFNPVSGIFKNYTIQDGFLDMEYGYNAYFRSESGELFFGGRNGLVSFYPGAINENKSIPPVVITDIKLFNKTVKVGDESGILKDQVSRTREIVLDHDQNVFTLNFSVLNYVKAAKNQFAYRLEGLEEEWNYVETPSATYTNLKPGTYTFMARGANNDGFWNPDPVALKIIVRPAPWKTIWAYLGYATIFITALLVLIRYQRIKVTLEHDLKHREFENDRQKSLNHAKLKFFTDISHEIRTPLTLMLTPIEDMVREYRSEPKLYRQLLLVKNNADRLLRLVNQLLDFRRRESGKVRLKAAEGNFIKFIKEISLAFQDQAGRRHITYTFSSDTERLMLYYDRDEMEKVFFNLISNAFKYTPDSESIDITISSGAKLQLENEEVEAVKIAVCDTGIGINVEDVENIFERYYEADHSGVSSLSTGIGLSLSKSIIKAHKGHISCESVKGAGGKNRTVFTVYLRVGKDHLQAKDIMEDFRDSEQIDKYLELLTSQEVGSVSGSGPYEQEGAVSQTILIVEDNAEIRSFLVDHLSRHYRVLEAVNGREALDIACETIPDLVISDVVMPEMDGIRLCSELKNDERTSHVPVIILTARTSLIHKVEGIDSGADEYLIKPFNLEVLKAKVRSLIESRDLLRKKYSREITLQPENIVISDPDEKFLQRAKSLLEAHVSDPEFNVNHFIKEIGMSRTVLYRKIKAITNMSIIDFINNYRLSKAAIILKTSNYNVSEIAFQVGFSDPKYFSRAFRKKFGVTPKKYISDMTTESQHLVE